MIPLVFRMFKLAVIFKTTVIWIRKWICICYLYISTCRTVVSVLADTAKTNGRLSDFLEMKDFKFPIHTEYFLSGGAMIFVFIELGIMASSSFFKRSDIPINRMK
jgi:hypothetical protein